MDIPFNRAYVVGNEIELINEAINSKKLCGNYNFNKFCNKFIEDKFGIRKSFLTPSGTSSLEMSSILCDIFPGDEVIMPSYTFSSTANAFCLRGARPVFAEIEEDTFVIDWKKIEPLITKKTKAIVPINYGGVSADLDQVLALAKKYNLTVVEDAAQGIGAKYKGRYIGSICPISIFSFHETKNISCGEGGALLLNDSKYFKLAEFAQEKGTDRSLVIAGLQNKYSWVSLGSSFLLSEILAAFLSSQLQSMDNIKNRRKYIHDSYTDACKEFVLSGKIRIQKIPDYCETNYHGFYIVFGEEKIKVSFLEAMKNNGVNAYIGYLPLHNSKMGQYYDSNNLEFQITNKIAANIVRLPLYNAMTSTEIEYACTTIKTFLKNL